MDYLSRVIHARLKAAELPISNAGGIATNPFSHIPLSEVEIQTAASDGVNRLYLNRVSLLSDPSLQRAVAKRQRTQARRASMRPRASLARLISSRMRRGMST